MILRRVMEHLKTQNWTAIGLEIMIVVIGVFLGIEVANWNAERQDERTAQQYIARIQDDLLANQRDMRTRITFFQTIRAHMLGALEALDDPPETLGRQFITDSFIASFTVARLFGSDTYDELSSGGAGNTALDVDTRQRLAQFYRVTASSNFFFLRIPPYHDTLRRRMPYKIQSQLRQSGCNSTFETDPNGEPTVLPPKDCRLSITDEEVRQVVAKLVDADLGPDLTHALADVDLKIILFQTTINRAQKLFDYLEQTEN